MKDLYTYLGIGITATVAQIRSAYRQKAMLHHPDKVGDSPEHHNLMVKINEAYEVLSDPAKRKVYDATLPKSNKRQTEEKKRAEQSPYRHPRDEWQAKQKAAAERQGKPAYRGRKDEWKAQKKAAAEEAEGKAPTAEEKAKIEEEQRKVMAELCDTCMSNAQFYMTRACSHLFELISAVKFINPKVEPFFGPTRGYDEASAFDTKYDAMGLLMSLHTRVRDWMAVWIAPRRSALQKMAMHLWTRTLCARAKNLRAVTESLASEAKKLDHYSQPLISMSLEDPARLRDMADEVRSILRQCARHGRTIDELLEISSKPLGTPLDTGVKG